MLINLAELEFGDGQFEQAVRLAAEALEIDLRGKNASGWRILTSTSLPIALRWEKWMARVRPLARGCAWRGRYKTRSGRDRVAAYRAALRVRGEVYEAARLIGYVNAQFEELGMNVRPPRSGATTNS